jgi:hypothetical protein
VTAMDVTALMAEMKFREIAEKEEFKQWDQNSKSEIKIQKEDYLAYWKQRIQRTVKLDVNFTKTWQIYTLKEEAAPFRKVRHGLHGFSRIENESVVIRVIRVKTCVSTLAV